MARNSWKAHSHKVDSAALEAADVIRNYGFIPCKIYGNLAHIANRLNLELLDDNARYLQMALLSQEIERKQLKGAIAELGVFRGGFSKFISRAFKDRTYYLFDTFSGFDASQIEHDSTMHGAKGDDFSDTSASRALGMIHPSSGCEMVVREGFFPATADGVDDEFVFVSIDVDLYEPTRDGLNFFYPRLVKGGYIMVHDLMADKYKGCREAVYEFCEKEGVSFVPLPDAICSALLVR